MISRRPEYRLTAIIALLALAGLVAAGCNGTFTFSKTFNVTTVTGITALSEFEGQLSKPINFRDQIGSDVDRLTQFRLLNVTLTLVNDPTDDWTFLQGVDYSLTISNSEVDSGNATSIASFTGNGPASQVLEITCSGADLAPYAKATSDTTITFTCDHGTSGQPPTSIDVNIKVKVKVTID